MIFRKQNWVENLNGEQVTADHGQSGETHDGGTEVVPHVVTMAAFILILGDPSVSAVKDFAKQSQFARPLGWERTI